MITAQQALAAANWGHTHTPPTEEELTGLVESKCGSPLEENRIWIPLILLMTHLRYNLVQLHCHDILKYGLLLLKQCQIHLHQIGILCSPSLCKMGAPLTTANLSPQSQAPAQFHYKQLSQ